MTDPRVPAPVPASEAATPLSAKDDPEFWLRELHAETLERCRARIPGAPRAARRRTGDASRHSRRLRSRRRRAQIRHVLSVLRSCRRPRRLPGGTRMSDTTAPQDWCVVHGRAKVRRDVAGFACWECPYCNAEVFTIPPAAVPVAAVDAAPLSADERQQLVGWATERNEHWATGNFTGWLAEQTLRYEATLRAVEAEREAAQEVVAAARCFVECSVRHDRTPYISENGRHGGSPWAELLDAIAAVDRAAAAASPARE